MNECVLYQSARTSAVLSVLTIPLECEDGEREGFEKYGLDLSGLPDRNYYVRTHGALWWKTPEGPRMISEDCVISLFRPKIFQESLVPGETLIIVPKYWWLHWPLDDQKMLPKRAEWIITSERILLRMPKQDQYAKDRPYPRGWEVRSISSKTKCPQYKVILVSEKLMKWEIFDTWWRRLLRTVFFSSEAHLVRHIWGR